MSERVWKLLSYTRFFVAVIMVKNNNGIHRNNMNFVSFLFRKMALIELILWFQANGSVFFSQY